MIGEVLASACADREVLARLGGRIGDAAREAAAEFDELSADDSRRTRARILAAARAPMPAGIRGVHPTWIEAGLVGLPARARTALANGGSDPIDIWLARWACAELPPLPAIDPALHTARSLDDAIRLAPAALTAWLAEVGTDQLAHAMRTAGRQALLAIATSVPAVISAATRIDHLPRLGALGPARAAIARCRDIDVARPESAMLIGARAIAPRVDALARRQLAVRLSRPKGLALLTELARFAHAPVDDGPTWAALGA
jgi:hypothetical protein